MPGRRFKNRLAEKKQVIYVCSPFSLEDTEANIRRAHMYCRYVIKCGKIPYAPHLLFPQFLACQKERARVVEMDLIMLARCDEVWVFGDVISDGMQQEIDIAKEIKIKVRKFKEAKREKIKVAT